MANTDEIKSALIAAWPPGVQDLIDWDDAPGNHIEAIADTIVDTLLVPVDELAASVTPLTASVGRTKEWERALDLASSRTTLFGELEQRQAQVVSRIRERGAPTVAMIQSVVAPLLDYPDPFRLVVLQTNRDEIRAKHTYPAGSYGTNTFSDVITQVIKFRVLDDAPLSQMGAQVDITLTHGDISQVDFLLTAPTGEMMYAVRPMGIGSATSDGFRIYFPNMTAASVYGIWTLQISAISGTGNVSSASLFVEGFGRDSTGHDGLSACLFEWAVVYEPSKSNGSPDFDAARAAIARLEYATRIGGLVFISDLFNWSATIDSGSAGTLVLASSPPPVALIDEITAGNLPVIALYLNGKLFTSPVSAYANDTPTAGKSTLTLDIAMPVAATAGEKVYSGDYAMIPNDNSTPGAFVPGA